MQIDWKGKQIGSVDAVSSGLYVWIRCVCPAVSRKICRLYIVDQGKKTLLGVMQPEGGSLRLEKRIPAREYPPGNCFFSLEEPESGFFPVTEEKPFACPEQLPYGRWEVREGIYGIWISRETGQ